MATFLDTLPAELMIEVSQHLHFADKTALSQVSKSVHTIRDKSKPKTALDYIVCICIAAMNNPSRPLNFTCLLGYVMKNRQPSFLAQTVQGHFACELMNVERSLDQYVGRFSRLSHGKPSESYAALAMFAKLIDRRVSGEATDKVFEVSSLSPAGNEAFSRAESLWTVYWAFDANVHLAGSFWRMPPWRLFALEDQAVLAPYDVLLEPCFPGGSCLAVYYIKAIEDQVNKTASSMPVGPERFEWEVLGLMCQNLLKRVQLMEKDPRFPSARWPKFTGEWHLQGWLPEIFEKDGA